MINRVCKEVVYIDKLVFVTKGSEICILVCKWLIYTINLNIIYNKPRQYTQNLDIIFTLIEER